MQTFTVAKTTKVFRSGLKCRQCHRVFKVGDIALSHNLGKDAPVDLRSLYFHASCISDVLQRIPSDRRNPKVRRAAEFRDIRERILAGGPVFEQP